METDQPSEADRKIKYTENPRSFPQHLAQNDATFKRPNSARD